jgi:oligopeptide transport system permease protein
MIRMILRRLLQLPLIVAAVYTLTLTLAWAVPGNPLENPEGRRPPPEVIAAMKSQYNLDDFWKFYRSYLYNASGARTIADSLTGRAARERDAARAQGITLPTRPFFDLGPSLQYRDRSVNEIIADALPISVTLGAIAILIALAIGLTAGILGAIRPNSWIDASTLALALLGISLPSFITASLLLLVFAVWLPIVPVGQWSLRAGLLASFALSLPFAAYIARLTRMGLIETLSSDFIRTARAKGLPESRVILKHALKNALLPVISYLGPATAYAMTGSFVVERVLNIPGLGQHFVNAVQNKDLFLIIGVVLIFSTLLVLLNLAVDVLYRWADPRTP